MTDDAKAEAPTKPEAQPGLASGLTPYLTIRDGRGDEASKFYQAAFGAEELFRHPAQDGKRLMHCSLKINGAPLMLSDDFSEASAPEPAGVTLHLEVDDADVWAKRAVAAGATISMPFADQFWGDRYGVVRDPFGHSWSIGSPLKK
jgi:PhnB protein